MDDVQATRIVNALVTIGNCLFVTNVLLILIFFAI